MACQSNPFFSCKEQLEPIGNEEEHDEVEELNVEERIRMVVELIVNDSSQGVLLFNFASVDSD